MIRVTIEDESCSPLIRTTEISFDYDKPKSVSKAGKKLIGYLYCHVSHKLCEAAFDELILHKLKIKNSEELIDRIKQLEIEEKI